MEAVLVTTNQSYQLGWFIADQIHDQVTIHLDDRGVAAIESGHDPRATDLREYALIDGLVNTHTHLEFSSFRSPIPTSNRFTDWIKAVVAHRRDNSELVTTSLRSGIQESLRSGTTLIGEIATVGWSWDDYLAGSMKGVVFQELLGLTADRVTQQQELADRHVEKKFKHLIAGLSPHAPYSTHLDLVDHAVMQARQAGSPLAMHLAETESEIEFLKNRTGEFRDMLTAFGLWNDDPARFGKQPMDYLERLAEAPSALVIHGNYLSEDELNFLANHQNLTLVYCPRTHFAFGHQSHPWQHAIRKGVRVALGTDSRASNPDLSLFAELQFLASQTPQLSHLELLKLGTTNGRKALLGNQRLRTDFTLVRLPQLASVDPRANLFSADSSVAATWIDGTWAWKSPEVAQRCAERVS